MPVVLICPYPAAYLFDIVMENYSYRTKRFKLFWVKKNTNVYDREGNRKLANSWLLDHVKYCKFKKEEHKVLFCYDPFEMGG